MAHILGHDERVAWLRLARTPRIGPLTFHRLIGRFASAAAAIEALPAIARDTPLTPISVREAEDELAGLDKLGARLLASCESEYPAMLARLPAPPPVLAARGELTLLACEAVAIVGSREASAAGLRMADILARGLGAAGFAIVSGLARGLDAAAHAAALETGTIAVLAGGLDRPYPPQNLKLHAQIVEQGCVVSEAPLGMTARARDFPRRNHIISGISRGVVVIEAAERSGSLITARAAGDQGREVMAVPGSPLDPRCRGSNGLIKEGAALIETAADVLAALRAAPLGLREPAAPLFEDQGAASADLSARLARLLSPTPVHVNDLARLLGVTAGALAGALTELELEGRASSLAGGYAAAYLRDERA